MTLAHPRAPQPTPANVDELARTRDWVERVERLVPPPGGVSRSALIAIGFAAAIAAAILLSRSKGSDRGGDALLQRRPLPREPAAARRVRRRLPRRRNRRARAPPRREPR